MPVQVSRQPHHSNHSSTSLTNTTSYSLRRESPASSRDDASSTSSIGKSNGDEGRQRKRLPKNPEATSIPRKPSLREPRSPAKPLARTSVREQKRPLITRAPDFSTLKPDAQSRILQASSSAPTSTNNAYTNSNESSRYDPESGKVTTFYAFGDSKLKGNGALEDPFDFQPSMNLEDVHRGIIDHEQINSYQSPSRKVSGASIRSLRTGVGSHVTEQTSSRDSAGSMLRRPSVGKFAAPLNREPRSAAREAAREAMAVTELAEAKEAPTRRRQSNMSALTGVSAPSAVRYRATAGTIEPASSIQGPGRQPSGTASGSLGPPVPPKYHRAGGYSETATAEEGVKVSARSGKSKSLQPPPRHAQGLALNTNTALAPDQYRASIGIPPRSPRSPNTAKKIGTPGSTASRRISTIPHASGLAARTISPTDARRLKRLSMLNTPPPPLLPNQVENTSTPGSPSILPTKSATPSSQATTPEPQRTSYSSGLSMSSTSTSARTSVGSLQPKVALNFGSRLPRPPQLERDDEDIPPVPPLPKNLASPAEIHSGDSSLTPSYENTPMGTYKSSNGSIYGPRKSSLAPDHADSTEPETQSIESDHTLSSDSPMSRTKSSNSNMFTPRKFSLAPDMATQCEPSEEPEMFDLDNYDHIQMPPEPAESPKPEKKRGDRERRKRGMTIGGLGAGGQGFQMLESKASSSSLRKKDLAPLRLPPLNLLPLSTPTIARVNAFGGASDSEGLTPPPRKGDKAPSTPMTASKASFFTRRDHDGRSSNYERSMSSFNHPHPPPAEESPSSLSLRAGSSASSSIPISTGAGSRIGRQTASPYVSGTLTRGTSATGSEKGTLSKRATPVQPLVKSQNRSRKSQDSMKNVAPLEDVTESPPSTSTSIRRKLSLSWKKTSQGKNSHAANERAEEYSSSLNSKLDSMQPPKLPTSSTWTAGTAATGAPSPSKGSATLVAQNRRKGSIGSTPLAQHDRTKSDSWGKDKKAEDRAPAPPSKTASAASSILSPMTEMLGSKGSLSQLRSSRTHQSTDPNLDHDDLIAEEEMRRIASKKKNLDQAANQMDDLKRRAASKDRMSPQHVLRMGVLNIFERGEIVDYKDVYFTGLPDAKKHVGDLKNTNLPNFGYDDERGDYAIVKGDHLAYRYEIIDVLGKGSFGQVVRCIDHRSGGLVAIKIIRNKKRFHQQALVEVNILQKLKEWDPQQKHSLINFTQSFYFRGHLCISTELLGMNLYEFIKSNDFRGFSLKLIRRFTKQMLSSLVLLKGHRVIHCDLKPENILLAHPAKTEIKVIDFGSSCFENEKVYTYIQSRFYRSPEVILGMSYGLPIDMWSLGCILAELYTGYPIFPGENEQEQLACIMEVFGPPEKHLIEKSTRRKLFFDSQGKPRMIVSSKGRRRRVSSKTLQHALKCDDEPFLDFVARCLRWDPEKRMRPEEAMNHEFITGRKPPAQNRSRSGNYASATASSDTRRYTAYSRPLPDPPVTVKKPTLASSLNIANSPMKLATGTPITTRNPTVKAPTLASASKRNSTGATIGSTLPRVAAATSNHRNISGKVGYGTGTGTGSAVPTPSATGRGSAGRTGTGTGGSIRMLRDDEAGMSSGEGGRSRR